MHDRWPAGYYANFEYIQETILDPCGMTDTGFFEMDIPYPNIVTGYYEDKEDGGRLKNNTLWMGRNYSITSYRERLPEVDTGYVEKMLARILELNHRPLTEARPPEKRLVGCCRDFATLFCAMARHQGISVRNRNGFATYFRTGFNVDHEIVEYWDIGENRWRLVDPGLSKEGGTLAMPD